MTSMYTSGEQEDLDGTELSDILDAFPDNSVFFCRVEKGQETYRIDCSSTLKEIPKGTQALIR